MKLIINILLVALTIFLLFLLIGSIMEPIQFDQQKKKRQGAVVDRLEEIRTCQEMYKNITGEYAPTFDTLREVLTTKQLFSVQLQNDPEFPDDPDKFIRDTTFYDTMDSLNAMGINLENLEIVPFSEDVKFDMVADTVTYQQTLVQVTQCGVQVKEFMGPYADEKYAKYDKTYDPNKVIKFGDLFTPSLAGNWE